MRSTVTMKIWSKKSIRVIIIRFLMFFEGFWRIPQNVQKNVKKRITIIQMNFLFQIFMVIVDRIKNRGFFFSQKLKKIKLRLKNGGSHAPVFNLAYFLKETDNSSPPSK